MSLTSSAALTSMLVTTLVSSTAGQCQPPQCWEISITTNITLFTVYIAMGSLAFHFKTGLTGLEAVTNLSQASKVGKTCTQSINPKPN